MSEPIATDLDVHTYFGLTYANYLVLHRTLMQSMPAEWQHRFVGLLEEYDAAFAHVERPESFRVLPGEEREIGELTPAELAAAGCERVHDGDDASRDEFYDAEGEEIEDWQRVIVPTSDPVPHYSRGRIRVEPRLPAGS